MEHRDVQRIAKETLAFAERNIKPGMSLPWFRAMCERKMTELGADSFWYWDVGAFVFAGDETAVSVSGREYITSGRLIADNDIVTVDLSPQRDGVWGDYARTIIIENGVVADKNSVKNAEWRNGLMMEDRLHQELLTFASPETTFEELYFHINGIIAEAGFVNLDFLGNLGHSIVRNKNDRIYIERGNTQKLGSVGFFTFEPHISVPGSKYGYKKENVYYFEDGKLTEL